MSFETFRVELRGGTTTFAQADAAIRQHPHAQPDHDSMTSAGSAYYTVADGSHVIEVEVADAPVKVSCRFTLCHPPTIDAAFLTFVREVQGRFGMEAQICADVRPEHARRYSVAEFSEFAAVVSGYMAASRAEWIANFGTTQLAAKTPEVYAKMILPRCVPVAG
jgi:hypothetical protein